MKNYFVALAIFVIGTSMMAIPSTNPTYVITPTQQDNCPAGQICIATNMTAKGYDVSPTVGTITGIAVYKINGEIVAKVPGHGTLKLYWATAGNTGWHFRANNGIYVIQNLGRDI